MASELLRGGSTVVGTGKENGYHGDQQSLRLRRAPSSASSHSGPRFDWSPSQEDEGAEESRDIRSLPMPMALKRAVRDVQIMHIPVVTSWQSWKRNKAKSLQWHKDNVQGLLAFFALWRKTLNKIGGNFGGGVQSFFLFLRFLVVLNFLSFLLLAGLVLVPSIIFRSVGDSTANSTDPEECKAYDPNPTGLVPFYNYFLDLLTGTGFMEYSYLFYGYYRNTMLVFGTDFSYNIPLAYLFTTIFYFAFCFICIIIRMGTAARVAVATGGGAAGGYSKTVFTSWDYGCQGDRATKLKQKNIHYQLQVDLEEERIKRAAASLTLWRKVLLYSLRFVLTLLTLVLIVAAFFGIFEATVFSQSQSGVPGFRGLFFEYLPSIVITAGNFIVPLLCDQIAEWEKYSPSTTVILSLLRSVVLRMVSLGVLLITLWGQVTCAGHLNNDKCQLCHYNHAEYPCWETRVGQEMYKLALFDLLITIAMLVLIEFPRRMVVDSCSNNRLVQWFGRQEFLVPPNVLSLVYGQTVVWTGALFCPLLPVINTMKFIILFYCKKITLFNNCRPAVKTFRSTTSAFFFLVVLLFGWMLAVAVMIYSMAEIRPSMSCGPFRFSLTMWAIVPTSFQGLSKTTRDFLFAIGSQSFSIPLFLVFFVLMFYFIALAAVYGKSVNLLRNQLKLEGRDKQFLVKQIEELTRKLGIPKDQMEPWD